MGVNDNMDHPPRKIVSRVLVIVGIALLLPSLVWLIGAIIGFLPAEPAAFGGHSGLRGIASLAVGGCLLSAIGAWER